MKLGTVPRLCRSPVLITQVVDGGEVNMCYQCRFDEWPEGHDHAQLPLLRQMDKLVASRFSAAATLRELADALEDGRWPTHIDCHDVGVAIGRAVAMERNPADMEEVIREGYYSNNYGYPAVVDDWPTGDRW